MTQAVRHDVMRARNLEVVLGAVSRGGPLTRAALAEVTGLTKSTVSKLVGDLVDAGLLAETGPARVGERGRPGVEVVLSGARVASLGLEINVDYLAARVLDLTGGVRFAARRERDNRGSRPKKVLTELQALATEALAETHRVGLEVAGAVLAVSGPVGDGVLFSAPNLGWHDVRPAELLRLPVPVELDNEANLAALGEFWYGGGERDFLYVSGEIGIGAGLVVNGTLFSGATGLAGELGHVVVAPQGPVCRCGGHGCLETFAGQEALLAAGGVPALPDLVTALERGDAAALAACKAAGQALGVALTSAVNLLDLDRIVLGGVFTQLYPWLSGPVAEVLNARLGLLRGAPPVLTASRLGGDAATLGAAGRVVHRVLADPASFVTRAQEA
ncbi:ROK family transcriptional regulator [Amycolatopsis australiensis]|uniref:Sugar kinase of the NBD/HSP70 family, may contain an N-terminal HTH domain n=1 Tax=Amycolatopsis australiensis TaxID=546364 RepID=A0A1K1RNB5_9PSEU|nr:ROK family transcriptional regulator [Amycolatopsis australiensis]SFW73410.1 Sugar kinase of the NBD/HSP70 family, may contain an N-terminal HTH domain [Amycolatopsis australiensis]